MAASRLIRIPLILVAATVVTAGCGGETDIADVRTCLEELGLNVEAPPEGDTDIEDGVFATSNLEAAGADEEAAADAEFTFAMAAIVPEEKARTTFEDQSKTFASSVDEDGKLEFDSGIDGEYVWVAGGETGSDSFDDVRGCVEP